MDAPSRRSRLAIRPNPGARHDYLCDFEASWAAPGRTLAIRYVPDRQILDPASLASYLETLGGLSWDSLEAMATAILDDLNNELVPRWIQVVLTAPQGGVPGLARHAVTLEDRQPRWDNKALLARLEKL